MSIHEDDLLAALQRAVQRTPMNTGPARTPENEEQHQQRPAIALNDDQALARAIGGALNTRPNL